MITETGRIFLDSLCEFGSFFGHFMFHLFSVFGVLGWGGGILRLGEWEGEIPLTPHLKAVLFQCSSDSFLEMVVLKVGGTLKTINYFCWFFSECLSSLLLLSCASKHTPLSVKTENCEPLVAVL